VSRIKGGEPSFQIWARSRPLGSRINRYVAYVTGGPTDGQTDGRTDGQRKRLLPLLYGRGHNNEKENNTQNQ